MINLVKQRTFQKVRRGSYEAEPHQKKSKKWRFIFIKIIWISFFVFALIYWGFLLLKNTLFSPSYTIKKINFNSWDISRYDEPYLFKAISYQLKWENYYVIKRNKWSITKAIQSQFPIISNLIIQFITSNTINIKLEFNEPELIIKNKNLTFWDYKWYLFQIYSWDKIWKWIPAIYMPDYLSGLTTLSWLFFQQSSEELVQQLWLIFQGFPKAERIEYLPWWARTMVYLDNKKFYINNLWDIEQQIKNFELLKKYYSEYSLLKEVDLGSLEKDKIIVKKY